MSTELPALAWDAGKYQFQRKLGNFVHYFQVNLPTNGYGIPLKLIDPIQIAQHIADAQTTDDIPDTVVARAELPVEFEDGFPVIEGTPIWERLDGEPIEYYKIFKEYREALYIEGSRAVARVAQKYNLAGKNLSALAKVYHWALRCKAYDYHKTVERERKRQYEIEKMESRHSRAAESLLEQAMSYLENHPEQMNPKIALQMVQLGMKAGRLALGLNPEKPGNTDSGVSTNIHINHAASSDLGSGSAATESTGQGSQPNPGTQDISQLQSILHILDKSGALDRVKIVDAEYSVVDDSEAVEST